MIRRNSSVLWTYFEKVGPSSEKKAMCLSCGDMYSYKSSTGNLKAHLKKRHNYQEAFDAEETFEADDEKCTPEVTQAVDAMNRDPDADMETIDETTVEFLDEGEILQQNSDDPLDHKLENDISALAPPTKRFRRRNSHWHNGLKTPKLQVSSRGAIIDEIESGKLHLVTLQIEIARRDLRMKEEEENQALLKYQYEERQREREEKIKEIELKIKEHQLQSIDNEDEKL